MNKKKPNNISRPEWPLSSECLSEKYESRLKLPKDETPNKRYTISITEMESEALKDLLKRNFAGFYSPFYESFIFAKIVKQIANEKQPNKRDTCISCNKETQYDEFDHIDSRYFYIEGAGQLCANCWNEIYA